MRKTIRITGKRKARVTTASGRRKTVRAGGARKIEALAWHVILASLFPSREEKTLA